MPANNPQQPEKLGEKTLSMRTIVQELGLTLLTQPVDFDNIFPSAGYTSDLLSCVMASAAKQGIWVTLQAHTNIVAVAALLDLSAVIITEDAMPEPPTIQKANQEGVVLFATPRSSFAIAGKLWEMGLRAE
ncbi:MAG: serine kinase [Anaerolineaceae bacterium]|nr:serine kinase [Anaerolineaceae bacterium]